MRKYEKLASFIINNIGGKDNIVNITHCMTRLRIKLKDNDKVNIEELKSNNNIISCQKAEGKLQVIIGTQVGEVYEEIIKQIGKVKTNEGTSQEGNSLINRFAATITKIVVPALGVLCACGIIAGLNSVLIATGMIESGSGTNILLNAMGNACLTFFPVILGYTSAVAFGMNPFVGMILGAVLIFPNISTDMNSGKVMFSIFANSPFKMDVFKTFFGLPIIFPATGYTSTLIPIMLINLCASKIEKFLDKQLPDVTKQFLAPFLTILIAGTVGVLVIGPISMIIQNGLQAGLSLLMDKSQILAFALITLIYQPLVIFGLHWPLITLGLMEFASTGSSLIVAAIFPASFTHMAACLAVFLRTKNIKMRNIAFPAFLSACFCIIEPSIYGVTLPVKKRFGFCMVGGLVGGLILALSNSPMFAISMGTTGIMSFVNPQGSGFAGLVWCVIACVAAMIITFVLTWITYRDEEDGGSEEDAEVIKKLNTKETIVAPMNGTIKPLDDMDDIAFANGSLGKGVCIVPNEGKVFSPCSGKVTVIFPTGHAIGIKSDDGAEILIHIGTDLYDKKELLFKKYVSQGDIVRRGQLLVSFDLNKMKEKNLNADTAVIVSNTNDYLDILLNNVTTVKVKDPIFTAVRAKSEFKEA